MLKKRLVNALSKLQKKQTQGQKVFRGSDFTPIQKNVLLENNYLLEIVKGWFLYTPPTLQNGDSTIWHATWKDFVYQYCSARFKKDWYLSPEQSLLIHAKSNVRPSQIIIHTPRGNNNTLRLPNHFSLIDYKSPIFDAKNIVFVEGLQVLSPEAALVFASETIYRKYSLDVVVVLKANVNISLLIDLLMQEEKTVVAGRIAGSLRAVGKEADANAIAQAFKRYGYTIAETNPFENTFITTIGTHRDTPFETRLRLMWTKMRNELEQLALIKATEDPIDVEKYMTNVEEIYMRDAYHSLSIEGYKVTEDLIKKVASGEWNEEKDQDTKNALAAKGYHSAFLSVKNCVEQIIKGSDAIELLSHQHQEWYKQLFSPFIDAGIIKAQDVFGYRNALVFIQGANHVPPSSEDARNGMHTYWELLKNETSPFARIVLGHFVFVFIHPYIDGNGRMARFIMNALMAAGGLPWTIVPVERRKEYLSTLEIASVGQDIKPFAKFIASCIAQ